MNSPVAGVSAAIGTIAWLDDDIKNYEHWVEALRQEGLRIDTFSAQTGLLNSLSRSKYDLIILDERLQRSSFGTALVAQIHKKNPDATFLLLSAYIVPENIQSKIDDLKQAIPDLQIYALSKSVVPPWKMSAFYSVFVRPILDIVKGVTSAIPFIRTAKPAGSSSGRFNISFDDYCDLPEQARFDLSSEFAKEKERVLDRFFATGAVWVCFYGDTDEPDFVAYDIAQVPPHSKIDSEAADKGIAAFCFGSPHRIESVSHPPLTETTSKCSRISGLQNYNFFKCGIGDLQLTAHFDSGAADVYLNSRLLMDNAIIRETVTATHIKTSIGVIFAQIEHLQFIIDLDGGFTEVVNHPVYAVRNYFTSVLAASAICGLECRTDTASICRFRQPGLIGRGLLLSNGLVYRVSREFEVIAIK